MLTRNNVTQDSQGDSATQIAGDANNVETNITYNNFYSSPPHILTKSKIYDLLNTMLDFTDTNNPNYKLEYPEDINPKLKHNRANKYIPRFHRKAKTLGTFNAVLNGFTDSEKIVSTVQSCFEDFADFNEDGTLALGNGSKQLDEVSAQLFIRITRSANFDNDRFATEDIEEFILVLMLHCVWKCKLLQNPKKDQDLDTSGSKQ